MRKGLTKTIAAGDAAVALLDKAREGDEARAHIAVGSRGLGLARRLKLSGVSTEMLRATEGSCAGLSTGRDLRVQARE